MKKVDKTQLLTENKELLEAVINEFAYKNYQEASINEIIKNAHYNKGSFYYRFKNKEELFVALLDYTIVEQISLFKDNNLSFSRIVKIEEMLFDLFNNLINLYNFNPDLYYVLTRHQSDALTRKIIDEQCLSPLIKRFFIQFKRFTYLPHYEDMLIVIENLYYNFPETILKSNNPSTYLHKLIGYLVASNSQDFSRTTSLSLDDFIPETNITYILSDNHSIKYNQEFLVLRKDIDLDSKIKNTLKTKNRVIFYNYRKVIRKTISSSVKDYSLFKAFVSSRVVQAVKSNPFFEDFLLSLFYYLMAEKPVIVIEHVLSLMSEEEKRLFLVVILPIISKTSKIIIVNENLELFTQDTDCSLYLLEHSSNLNILNYRKIIDLFGNSYLYSYYRNNHQYFKTISQDDIASTRLADMVIDDSFDSLKRIVSITYDEVIKSEDLYEKNI